MLFHLPSMASLDWVSISYPKSSKAFLSTVYLPDSKGSWPPFNFSLNFYSFKLFVWTKMIGLTLVNEWPLFRFLDPRLLDLYSRFSVSTGERYRKHFQTFSYRIQERDRFRMERVTDDKNKSEHHIRNKCFHVLENVTTMGTLGRKCNSLIHKVLFKAIYFTFGFVQSLEQNI